MWGEKFKNLTVTRIKHAGDLSKGLNPVPHGLLCPLLSHSPRTDLPYKNKANLPEGRELRDAVIAALSLRVS
jgi:hypothetical protein